MWAKAWSEGNLQAAWDKVRESRGCAGVDGVSLKDFERFCPDALGNLRGQVLAGRYAPLPLRRLYLPKKSGGLRALGIPAVRDRVAQAAVTLVLGPVLDETFADCSWAYRPGRGPLDAVRRVEELRREGHSWALDADIDDFFDEVDHRLLRGLLSVHVDERRLLRLINSWLCCPAVHNGRVAPPTGKGLPQGAVVSPLLANLYLTPLDDALLRPGMYPVRYADDFMVFADDRAGAEKAWRVAEEALGRLNLRLEPSKTRIASFEEGFEYLGAQFGLQKATIPWLDRMRHGRYQFTTPALRPAPRTLVRAGWRSPLWDEDLAPISALADYAFCPRAFYFRHVWGEEAKTPEMVRAAMASLRAQISPLPGAEVVVGVPVLAPRLGVQGVIDAVESKWDLVWPVELKYSRWHDVRRWHRVQVAAEAMALEETTGERVRLGYVYFLPRGPRELVMIRDEDRAAVIRLIEAANEIAVSETIPPLPEQRGRCGGCSMRAVCLPEETGDMGEQVSDMIGWSGY